MRRVFFVAELLAVTNNSNIWQKTALDNNHRLRRSAKTAKSIKKTKKSLMPNKVIWMRPTNRQAKLTLKLEKWSALKISQKNSSFSFCRTQTSSHLSNKSTFITCSTRK